MKILLVRLREIGDVVFTTPAVRALRRRFTNAYIGYIVEPAAAPVVTGNPHLDEIIVAPRERGLAGVAADLALGRRMRAKAYDVAIDFHGGPRASLLTWLSGAHERIGYEIAGRAWMYTTRVARARELRPRHSVENQWDLLRPLGIDPVDRASAPVEMPVDRDAAATVSDRLTRAGVAPSDPIIVIHVSAGNPFRRWPLEQFVALATRLAAGGSRRRIVITSGPSERGAAQVVIDRAAALSIGELSLAELRALLERAVLYIGGDSGPLHIAATSRVPIVGLYGPTLPERSAPWRAEMIHSIAVDAGPLPCRPCDQRRCTPGDFRCLTTISADRVWQAAEQLLRAARAADTPQATDRG